MQAADVFPFALVNESAVQIPDSIIDRALVAPGLEGRTLQKWLKKQRSTSVMLVMLESRPNDEEFMVVNQVLDLLSYLRQVIRNRNTRLICFVTHSLLPQFGKLIDSHDIHRLQSLEEYSPELLNQLLMAEYRIFQEMEERRGNRDIELELMTWLARVGRRDSLPVSDQAELMKILMRLTHADIAVRVGSDAGSCLHPAALITAAEAKEKQPPGGVGNTSVNAVGNTLQSELSEAEEELWQPVIDSLAVQPDDRRTMGLELHDQHDAHRKASVLTGLGIQASLYLPLRCYDEMLGGVLLMMASDRLAHMEVALINLLEKVMDQLRVMLERQRTQADLQTQFSELQSTLVRLKETKDQLYHAEKLASVGTLAAGIAHEINNPIAFVLSNFEPLNDYIQDITGLLKRHEELFQSLDTTNSDGSMDAKALSQQVQQAHKDADLEFILGDVNDLVKESRTGLLRVRDIVSSLRNFARKDGPDLEQGDLVQIYRDSLTILRGKIGDNIQIQEQVPERAEAWCNPGQMGQVFVNLLQNAAQAMPEGGVLTIRIQALDESWQIDIEDTGHGIPEPVRDKVFDPFFTTRPIGEGVGLGLSMVFGIIQRHQGRIEALPKDPGTLFRIELPKSSSQK